MTSGNGTGVKLSMAECMAELKAFRQVLENVKTTNRTVLEKLDTKQSHHAVFEENRKKITDMVARGDQLVHKLEDRDRSLNDLTDTVSSLCGRVDGLLSDFSSIEHTSRQNRRRTPRINTAGGIASDQVLDKQPNTDRQSTDTGLTSPCDDDINRDEEATREELSPVTKNSRGYKRRLTDDRTDNRLICQTNVRTLPQKVTPSKPEAVNVERRSAVVQRSGQTNSENNLDASLQALALKRGGNPESGLSGLLSSETSTMPGLDECEEKRLVNLGNNAFVAFHVFQKWFSYAETEKAIGSVSGLARGRGPDTVLCLDTSASMEGEPFQKMIEFAIDFVSGVETLKALIDIEENISVTTIGQVTKVWIHMTSDYSAVKATLREIQALGPRGRSPIAGGLLVALAGCLGNGQNMLVGDVAISPRIVLISDGRGTPDHIKSGPDMTGDSSVNIAAKTIVDANLKDVCENLKRRHDKVYCIPVGDADRTVLDNISKITSGKVYLPTQLERVLRSMDKTIAAAQLLARVIGSLGYIPPGDGMRRLFDRVHEHRPLTQEDRAEVLDQAQVFVEELPDHLLTSEHDDDLPTLGTRVRRGPGWKHQDQDSKGVGTVCSHGKDGKVWVEWDNGNRTCYEYTNETKDVEAVNEPRVLKSDELIATGCRVTRGDTWPYGDEDGGPGSVGVVVRVFFNGTVVIRWSNKSLSNLKYGEDGEFEVKIYTEDSHSLPDRTRTVPQSGPVYIESALPSIGDMNRRNRNYNQ